MNMDRLITMVINRVIRMVLNKGINAGVNAGGQLLSRNKSAKKDDLQKPVKPSED